MTAEEQLLLKRQDRAIDELIEAYSLRHDSRKYLPYRFPKRLRRVPMPPVATAEELKAANKSAFYWWWRFLKASPDYPPKKAKIRSGPVADMRRDFGDLGDDFDVWWQKTGRDLFHEATGSPVRVLWDSGGEGWDSIRRMLIIEVHIDTPLKEVLMDLQQAVSAAHAREELEWWDHRDAKRTLFPKKIIQTRSFDEMLRVWEQALKVDGNESGQKETLEWTRLAAATGIRKNSQAALVSHMKKHYRRAQKLVHHAARGDFPREDPIVSDEDRDRRPLKDIALRSGGPS